MGIKEGIWNAIREVSRRREVVHTRRREDIYMGTQD